MALISVSGECWVYTCKVAKKTGMSRASDAQDLDSQ